MAVQKSGKIILFDGICNLCSGFVRFVIKRDKRGVFKFASIQSDMGEKLLKEISFPVQPLTSIIYIHGSLYYSESTAVLKIFRELNGLWRLSYAFMAIPKPVRDTVYRFIARNRYKIFGTRKTCFLPTASLKERFLE